MKRWEGGGWGGGIFHVYLVSLSQATSLLCHNSIRLTLLLLNTTCPVVANSVDPDQLASEEAN